MVKTATATPGWEERIPTGLDTDGKPVYRSLPPVVDEQERYKNFYKQPKPPEPPGDPAQR